VFKYFGFRIAAAGKLILVTGLLASAGTGKTAL